VCILLDNKADSTASAPSFLRHTAGAAALAMALDLGGDTPAATELTTAPATSIQEMRRASVSGYESDTSIKSDRHQCLVRASLICLKRTNE
jgi:hypothetical protein